MTPRNALPAEPSSQVFVDSSGRRKRLVAFLGFVVALFATLYLTVVGASVVQAADAGLSTRATISATPSASASAD
ncbi:hypothetical protein JIG36_24850 [Actinoplanes sp. LDG1-06]|uniref:Uncharacterized protein n=1 Tax=Paractinoplanes ovalisporus TaxID=2810368 RepID=A0ABS2AG36_9ACTN|nr:hypothetical protein [Actinoplanes ovalisporus]MBM2618792.1 hypothetical protein [Actinoplanes ovalisporus]